MSSFEIIENTYEAAEEFGFCYGYESYTITKEDIQALLDGKTLATTINADEYSIFIELGEGVEDEDLALKGIDILKTGRDRLREMCGLETEGEE